MGKKWEKILYQSTIYVFLFSVGVLNGHQGYLDRNTIEVDRVLNVPVYKEERYQDKETQQEILRIFQNEGVHAQQAIFIALYSGVDLNKVLEGNLTYEQYSSIVHILTNSMDYHIQEYSEFETKDERAKEYHTNLLQALKYFHNSLVYYFSALIVVDDKMEVDQTLYANGIEGVNNYFDYIGHMESLLEEIEQSDNEGYTKYVENVKEAIDLTKEDIDNLLN